MANLPGGADTTRVGLAPQELPGGVGENHRVQLVDLGDAPADPAPEHGATHAAVGRTGGR
ncbi:hypothetical protein [Streptacidiphilus sp. EB103A]|uniref:hypothetical protein n=1 Tax=Streptacidiphilus sp. EB103A TaxID=3156275 RepID=UPI003514B7BE